MSVEAHHCVMAGSSTTPPYKAYGGTTLLLPSDVEEMGKDKCSDLSWCIHPTQSPHTYTGSWIGWCISCWTQLAAGLLIHSHCKEVVD